ncbi:MAG: hypothetical protein ACFFB3_17270 [Candidatus Hodarchaeota archaeon]
MNKFARQKPSAMNTKLLSLANFLESCPELTSGERYILQNTEEIQVPFYKVLSHKKIGKTLFIMGVFFPPQKRRLVVVTLHMPGEDHEIGLAKIRLLATDSCELTLINVREELQRRGLGRWLLWGVITVCSILNINNLLIFQITEAGHHLFRSYGFTSDEIQDIKAQHAEDSDSGSALVPESINPYYHVRIKKYIGLQEPLPRSEFADS